MIGRTLGGYRIVEQIGMGGMATVYKAFDAATDRYVALKTLPQQYSQDPQFVERFRLEARAIAKLEHIHILPVHAYGEEDGIAYLVMRYLPAGTLADRIRAGKIPLSETARLINQIASALDHAHASGILHRDVKPANVLIDRDGNAYLTDFGIARMVEGTLNLTGDAILGTPQYMSPEQCQGRKDLTQASDQYALGVVLYEMLTGRTPFQAETPLAVIHMQMMGAPLPPPSTLLPDLPEAVEQVVLKALAREPKDRYPSCGALAQALAKAVQAPRRTLPGVDTEKTALPDVQTTKLAPPATRPAVGAAKDAPTRMDTPRPARRPLLVGALALAGLALAAVVLMLAAQGGDSSAPATQAITPAAQAAVQTGTAAADAGAPMQTATAVIQTATGQAAALTADAQRMQQTATAAIFDRTADAQRVEQTANAQAQTLTADAAAAQQAALHQAQTLTAAAPTATGTATPTLSPTPDRETRVALALAADRLAADGEALAADFRYDEAIAAYDRALELAPDSVPALLGRGRALHATGKIDAALADFERVTDLAPRRAETFYLIGNVHRDVGDYEAAVSAYSQALTLNPQHVVARVERGRLRLWTGDAVGALEDLNQALTLNPRESFAYVDRGYVYLALNDLPAAYADFNRAVELIPEDPWARKGRATTLLRAFYESPPLAEDMLGQALEDVNRALGQLTDDADLIALRGEIYLNLWNTEAALADYARALALQPDNPQLLVKRAWMYIRTENYPAALADADAALALQADLPDAHHVHAVAAWNQGQYEEAISAYSRAIGLLPDHAQFYFERGQVYGSLSDVPAALADFNRALELKPDYYGVFYQRGYLYQGEGRLDEARADFDRAIALDPNNADGYRARVELTFMRQDAGIALDSADRTLALADASRVVELTPEDSYAYLLRGRVFARFGQPSLAVNDFARAIALYDQNWEAYLERGHILLRQNRGLMAIRDFNQVIALLPDAAVGYEARGRAYLRMRQAQRALEDFQQARRLSDWDVEAVIGAARAAAMLADYPAAVEAYMAAGEMDSAWFSPDLLYDYLRYLPPDADPAAAFDPLVAALAARDQRDLALLVYGEYADRVGGVENLSADARARLRDLEGR